MALFFIADTHFGHENVIKHDNRPYNSVDEMDEHLIERWNQVVKPKDEVWHLGDFCFRSKNPPEWYLKRLNGKINLVLGNHDYKSGILKCADKLNSVQDYKFLKYYKQKIVLFHYPILSWSHKRHGSWHFHGHTHRMLCQDGTLQAYQNMLCVSCNVWEYAPLDYERLRFCLTYE